ncbi:sigma-70 family RNA polymerase sigma factor [Thalassovita mediterranea]|nr:sigma-70 family RNA polymerase sigma factor [Thalassovita mediterranea]
MSKPEFAKLNLDLTMALAACAEGDAAAFKEVYRLTAPKFFAILKSQLKDAEAAKDVLQEAYVSIWKNAHRFDADKGNAFTWMLVIMRNRGLDRLRAEARAPVTEEIAETVPDSTARPEQQARTQHLGLLLERHLAKLPEQVSLSISLNVVQGMTCREIGHILEVSPNTVKAWVRRGLKKLRADMPVDSVSAVL